jgi:hypothetical protein
LGQNAPAIGAVATGLADLSGNPALKSLAGGLTRGVNYAAVGLPAVGGVAGMLGGMAQNYGVGRGFNMSM